MELIWTQPGFKYCSEPLNIRSPKVRQELGVQTWVELYAESVTEKFLPYFQRWTDGSLGFANPSPFRRRYRPLSRRIVFKILHGGEDRIQWFKDKFQANVVFLIRHPIPTSLSREELPRLKAYVNSDYVSLFVLL